MFVSRHNAFGRIEIFKSIPLTVYIQLCELAPAVRSTGGIRGLWRSVITVQGLPHVSKKLPKTVRYALIAKLKVQHGLKRE